MPRLAAFPKAWMDPLCKTGAMRLRQWIELALEQDGPAAARMLGYEVRDLVGEFLAANPHE